MIDDELRRKALRKFRRLDEQAEALRLRAVDLQHRHRDARHALTAAERDLAEAQESMKRSLDREALDPRLEREVTETRSEAARLEAAHEEASRAYKAAKQLVDRCREYLIEHGAHPDAPLLREGREDPHDRSSRGSERVPFHG